MSTESHPPYIDGFVLPISRDQLALYQEVAEQVAKIWKEHGALSYQEYVGDDMTLEGTGSFENMLDSREDEVVVFGWVSFPSKAVRDQANAQVAQDQRMEKILSPLLQEANEIFDARRMCYGGYSILVPSQ